MKKMVALVVALCTAALGFTACSIPNAGKLEIIKSPTVAAGSQEAASETQDDNNETDTQEETGQPEATPSPAADPDQKAQQASIHVRHRLLQQVLKSLQPRRRLFRRFSR